MPFEPARRCAANLGDSKVEEHLPEADRERIAGL